MGRGYERELRFYVHVIKAYEEPNEDGFRVAKGEPEYLTNDEFTTSLFINAQHFPSFESARAAVTEPGGWKDAHPEWTFIIRSLYVEVNGFDLGAIV